MAQKIQALAVFAYFRRAMPADLLGISSLLLRANVQQKCQIARFIGLK